MCWRRKAGVGAHSHSHRGEQQSANAWYFLLIFCEAEKCVARFIRKIYESVCCCCELCVCGELLLLLLVALKRFMCNSIFSGAQHTHCAERESAGEQRERVCVFSLSVRRLLCSHNTARSLLIPYKSFPSINLYDI